jgi:D-alanine transaminase
MTDLGWVFLNDRFVQSEDAVISPFDRGFLFAHAAYEVTAVFKGQLIDFDGHIERLEKTLAGLSLPNPMSKDRWHALHTEILRQNEIEEGLIYLQVSGGTYGFRDFAGPKTIAPTVFMFAVEKPLINDMARDGASAITLPDTRWARRDLKTTQLLSQALAYRTAQDGGSFTAIMHEDGIITEAASANVWIVNADGHLVTRHLSPSILPGITRASAVDMILRQGVEIKEEAFNLEALHDAQEVFTTSAGALIAPITKIDNLPVSDGLPGPVTRQVQKLYYTKMGADLSGFDWL